AALPARLRDWPGCGGGGRRASMNSGRTATRMPRYLRVRRREAEPRWSYPSMRRGPECYGRSAAADCLLFRFLRLHDVGRKLDVGADAGGLRRTEPGKAAGASRRLGVGAVSGGAAVPESL